MRKMDGAVVSRKPEFLHVSKDNPRIFRFISERPHF